MVEAALAAVKTKDSYLTAHYRRVLRRRGHPKAIIAVAHSLLIIVYHVLSEQLPYADLGGDYFERHNQDAIQRRCIRQLERLGLPVTVSPKRRPPLDPNGSDDIFRLDRDRGWTGQAQSTAGPGGLATGRTRRRAQSITRTRGRSVGGALGDPDEPDAIGRRPDAVENSHHVGRRARQPRPQHPGVAV